jgi:class 3 adenylate cyclase
MIGWVSNIEYVWEEPTLAGFLNRLASFSRLIIFDKQGTGLSDRVSNMPTLEERMDDVRAVMDAVGSSRAALFGISEGGSMCALFAATYPERTQALIICGSFAKRIWSPDYPWAPTPEERQHFFDEIMEKWGGVVDLAHVAPSMSHDERFKQWWAAYLRRSASPGDALAFARMNTEIDIRHVLPTIHVPTLILHRTGDRDAHIDEARYMASQIPESRLVEFPGEDHLPWVGDSGPILDEIELFLTGELGHPTDNRILTTLLFTDIVDSTRLAASLGDAGWRQRLEAHNAVVRGELRRYHGREVKHTGDGIFAAFDGPARAIRCAQAIATALKPLGLVIRCGLHTGECEVIGSDLGGIAVHACARIAALAGPGEILVSSTVTHLVAGSGLRFRALGPHILKGIPGEWPLFAVTA